MVLPNRYHYIFEKVPPTCREYVVAQILNGLPANELGLMIINHTIQAVGQTIPTVSLEQGRELEDELLTLYRKKDILTCFLEWRRRQLP